MNRVTEKTAKATWTCPSYRPCINETDVVYWAKTPLYVHQMCCGSACPVWRWSFTFEKLEDGKAGEPLGFCGHGGAYGLSTATPVYTEPQTENPGVQH